VVQIVVKFNTRDLFSAIMDWYLIDAEDNSFCTVFCKNILQLPVNRNKPIAKGEKVSFFCEGKKWDGIIIDANGMLSALLNL